MLRYAILACSMLAASPAWAGGIGVLGTGGIHTEQVYFYSNVDADGRVVRDPSDYEQFQLTQILPNYGAGLEFLIGDRGAKLNGSLRLYWQGDAAQADPAEVTKEVDKANVVANYRDTSHNIGISTLGLNIGIVGDPNGLLFGAAVQVGAGVLTNDHTEFLLASLGPSLSYNVTRTTEVWGEVAYNLRFRKGASHQAVGTMGLRYYFD